MSNVQRIGNAVYGPKIDIEADYRGFGRLFFDKMQEHGQNIFQIDPSNGVEETYDFVRKKSIRVALEMKERDIKENDIVLVCSGSNLDNVIPIFGTIFLNAVTVTLDPSISLRDTTHLLKIVQPKMIFVEEASCQLIENALAKSEFVTEIIVIGSHSKYSTYSEFLQPKVGEDSFVPEEVKNIKDTAVIYFSSGTTGLPKCIELSHYSLMYNLKAIREIGFNNKVTVFFTSYYWLSAFLYTAMIATIGGRKLVVKGFVPEKVMKYVHEYKATHIFLSPSLSYKITDELAKTYPCPKLQSIMFGGGSLNPVQLKRLRNCFPNAIIFLCYAQTESSGVISHFRVNDFSENYQNKFASSGMPAANTIIKIVNIDTNEVLGLYEKGEIRVNTPGACNGYYNQDSSNICDQDGFIKTGDVGYFDEDNCLFVCDRIKDMFKYQSWHIIPLSLETVILQHPSVVEALVIGIPADEDDHIPMAIVVLGKDVPPVRADDLLKFANERLTEREQLRGGLKIVKDLPKGPTGKVSRKYVTDLVISGQLQELLK